MKKAILIVALLPFAAGAREIACTKIGFEPGTPDPNYCVVVGPPVSQTKPGQKQPPKTDNTLRRAKNYADNGDERTLHQSSENAAKGDSETLESANKYAAEQVSGLRKEAFTGVAQAAALAPMEPNGDGKSTVNIGVATYEGQSAIGISYARQIGQMTFNAGVSTSGRRSLARVGLGWSF